MVIAFDVAGFPVAQAPILEVTSQVTTSLFRSVLLINVALFDPVVILFTFHWYEGFVPPFVTAVVKVTLVPAVIVPAGFAVIITLTGSPLLTFIVMVLEFVGLPVTHPPRFEVMIQYT